jgi:hypothetical protein
MPSSVPQALLAEYVTAAAAVRAAKLRQGRLRLCLIEAIDAGAEVELGQLELDILETTRRSLSFDKLAALLGEAEASALRDRITPTRGRVLVVRPTTPALPDESHDDRSGARRGGARGLCRPSGADDPRRRRTTLPAS